MQRRFSADGFQSARPWEKAVSTRKLTGMPKWNPRWDSNTITRDCPKRSQTNAAEAQLHVGANLNVCKEGLAVPSVTWSLAGSGTCRPGIGADPPWQRSFVVPF